MATTNGGAAGVETAGAVTMSAVWDRAAAVIAARSATLVPIVLLSLWLPGLVLSGLRFALLGPAAFAAGTSAPSGGSPLLSLLALAVTLIAAVGHLALVAAAGDIAVSRRDAVAIALRRLGTYVGLVLLLLVAAALLFAPVGIVVAAAYPSMAAMQAGTPPSLSGGGALFVTLYGLVAFAVLVWVQARLLSVLAPVIVHERLGLGSYARAFRLTRGLGWRLVGVVLLYVVVALVLVIAVRSVAGVTLILALGQARLATALFLTGAAVGLVACVLATAAAAFTAQLYAVTAAARPAA